MTETTWRLMRGKTCLGLLRLRDTDQPFFHCDFSPRPEYATYEPLFEAEAAALESGSGSYDDLAAQVDALGLSLVAQPGGTTIDAPLLHISQGAAWFRY